MALLDDLTPTAIFTPESEYDPYGRKLAQQRANEMNALYFASPEYAEHMSQVELAAAASGYVNGPPPGLDPYAPQYAQAVAAQAAQGVPYGGAPAGQPELGVAAPAAPASGYGATAPATTQYGSDWFSQFLKDAGPTSMTSSAPAAQSYAAPSMQAPAMNNQLQTLLAQLMAPATPTAMPQVQMPSFTAPTGGGIDPALQARINSFMDQQGKSTGLSPETLATLRTQALESVPAKFDRAEQDLMTSLLRRGGAGGNLPAGGSFLQGFAPLAAAKEAESSRLLQDITLQDEAERRRTGDLNNDRAFQGLGLMAELQNSQAGRDLQANLATMGFANDQALALLASGTQLRIADLDASMRTKLAAAGIINDQQLAQLQSQTQLQLGKLQSGTQLTLGQLDADTRKQLAAAGILNDQQLAQLQANTQLTLGQLDANTRRDLASMGITSDQALAQLQSGTQLSIASLDAQTRAQLAAAGITNDQQLAKLQSDTQRAIATGNNQTALEIARIDQESGSFLKGTLFPSLLASLMSGGKESLAAQGIGSLLDVLKGGDGKNPPIVDPGLLADLGLGGGGSGATANKGTGLGAATMNFLTNPITVAVGAGLLAATAIVKSQAHWEANTFVKEIENPMGEKLSDVHDEFFNLVNSGQMSKANAVQVRAAVQQLQNEFNTQADVFAKDGSDEARVSKQGKANLGQWFTAVINAMDGVIPQLA